MGEGVCCATTLMVKGSARATDGRRNSSRGRSKNTFRIPQCTRFCKQKKVNYINGGLAASIDVWLDYGFFRN